MYIKHFCNNVIFNIFIYLFFKERYYFALTTKRKWNLFKIFKHNEIITINYDNYRLINKWNNVKFKCTLIEPEKNNDIYKLNNAYHLIIKKPKNINYISPYYLNNVKILNLSYCSNIVKFGYLKNTIEINLSKTYITDVSPLSHMNKVELYGCKYISDVSSLKNVKYLDISFTNVQDVSELGNVYDLNLCGCKYLRDVSNLGNVHKLNISYTFVSDISKLKNVHTLNISNCNNIRNNDIYELKPYIKCLIKSHNFVYLN